MQYKKYIYSFVAVLAGIVLSRFLSAVFAGALILPQTISVGPASIHYYGLILGLAVIVAYIMAGYQAGKVDLNSKVIDQLLLFVFFGGLIGARLYHVVSSFDYYVHNPATILNIWEGGLSIYGAIIGGVLGLWLAHRKQLRAVSFWSLLDMLVPAVLIGQVIGRFGNLFNYELVGYPTHLPWKMFVPEVFRPLGYESQTFFHPLFLYESLFLFIVFAGIMIYQDKKGYGQFKPGTLFLWYVLLYNTGRFFLEFLRIDSVFIGEFRQNAIVSLILVLVVMGILIYRRYAKVPQRH
jgi:phosphatidylglycerol:prolipoprotein diacylglycerol transferase